MKLTKEIVEAMAKTIEEMGSQRAFSEQTGIGTQNISKYMNGKVKNIRPEIWKKLYPHIVRWLPSWPGGFPEDGSNIDEQCCAQGVKIFHSDGKISFVVTDSEGISLNLRLEKVSMKKYNYMDSVTRSMFPSRIVAEIKEMLKDVSTDEKMLNPDIVAPKTE